MLNFSSDIIEIAISIVFVVLLFSIFHSGVMELLQILLRSRNHFLLSSLNKVFNDRSNINLCEKIFTHPIIKTTKPQSQTLPAYISSDFFSDSMISVLNGLNELDSVTVDKVSDITNYNDINTKKIEVDTVLDTIKTNVANFKHSPVKVLLNSILLQSDSIEDFRNKLGRWYDGYMERVSSQYKRKLMFYSMLLGISVAVIFNANVIVLLKAIQQDKTLRTALVIKAELLNNEHAAQIQNESKVNSDSATTGKIKTTEEAINNLKNVAAEINQIGLPIGWSKEPDSKLSFIERNFKGAGFWEIAFGWILMGIGMSFGSEYWFNILSKIFQIRGVVKPTKKENSK
ncbi:MAG: hypothetical protein IPP71_07900 [Bacteroidetes bacterium]|nr:hypothetical protein [Bacteroidota bacterium]